MSRNLDLVTEYLLANYYNDVERLANTKMIAAIATSDTLPFNPNSIDKIALFNGINKSFPPKAEELAKEFIEGINFVMFIDRTSKNWNEK